MNLGRLAISLPLPLQSARRCVEIARRAEREWGYPAIWLAETNGPDSFALGGAIAGATSRVTLGTAIVPSYNRTPAVLAMSAATLAELSQGRFVLGLGSSSHAIIEDWNGLPFELPLTRLRETVTVVRQALAGGKTSFQGKTLRSRGFRLGNPPARPVPIYLAALREKMLALAGEIGDGVIVNLFPVTALPQMLAALRSGAARAGRDASGARGRLSLPGRRDRRRRSPRAGWCASPSPATSRSRSTTPTCAGAASKQRRTPWRRPSRAATAPRAPPRSPTR